MGSLSANTVAADLLKSLAKIWSQMCARTTRMFFFLTKDLAPNFRIVPPAVVRLGLFRAVTVSSSVFFKIPLFRGFWRILRGAGRERFFCPARHAVRCLGKRFSWSVSTTSVPPFSVPLEARWSRPWISRFPLRRFGRRCLPPVFLSTCSGFPKVPINPDVWGVPNPPYPFFSYDVHFSPS